MNMKKRCIIILIAAIILVIAICLVMSKRIDIRDVQEVDYMKAGILIEGSAKHEFQEFILNDHEEEAVVSELKKVKKYKKIKGTYSIFPVPESDGTYWIKIYYLDGTEEQVNESGSYVVFERPNDNIDEYITIIGKTDSLGPCLREICYD